MVGQRKSCSLIYAKLWHTSAPTSPAIISFANAWLVWKPWASWCFSYSLIAMKAAAPMRHAGFAFRAYECKSWNRWGKRNVLFTTILNLANILLCNSVQCSLTAGQPMWTRPGFICLTITLHRAGKAAIPSFLIIMPASHVTDWINSYRYKVKVSYFHMLSPPRSSCDHLPSWCGYGAPL